MGVKRTKIQLSIVVPCYNEGENLPLLARRFADAYAAKKGIELVLVDNGSEDGSRAIMRALVAKDKRIRIVSIKKNIGYGNGIWQGLRKARGEYLCWTHADLQTDIGDPLEAYLLAQAQNEPQRCFTKGQRKGRPLIDRIFTAGMSMFETLMLKDFLHDINAQPNLFHRNLLKDIHDPPKDFSFDLYVYCMAKKKGYKVMRFPVLFVSRLHGQSSWNTGLGAKMRFMRRTISYTFALKRRKDL